MAKNASGLTQLMTARTAIGIGEVFEVNRKSRLFVAKMTGVSGTATVKLQGAIDEAGPFIEFASLAITSAAPLSAFSEIPYPFVRAQVTAIAGTTPSVDVAMGVGAFIA